MCYLIKVSFKNNLAWRVQRNVYSVETNLPATITCVKLWLLKIVCYLFFLEMSLLKPAWRWELYAYNITYVTIDIDLGTNTVIIKTVRKYVNGRNSPTPSISPHCPPHFIAASLSLYVRILVIFNKHRPIELYDLWAIVKLALRKVRSPCKFASRQSVYLAS